MPNSHLFHPLTAETVNASIVPIRVEQVVRKLRGGSQPYLVRCDDGALYVVKCFPNPQGPNTLANEWIGSIITSGLGVNVPRGKKVLLTRELIDASPLLRFEDRYGTSNPPAGVHFASRMVGNSVGNDRPQEYKPRRLEHFTDNRVDYLKMRLIDLWADTQDTREFVWVPNLHYGTVKAFFLDHGHMFSGPYWDRNNPALCRRASRFQLLGGIGWPPETVNSFIQIMEEKIPALLSRAVSEIPDSWYTGDLGVLQDVLLDRLDRVRDILSGQLLIE